MTTSLQAKIKAIYKIVVNTLNNHNHQDHYHTKVPSTEVLTLAIYACLENNGNYSKTLNQFREVGIFKQTLEKSRFGRRLAKLIDFVPLIINLIQKQSRLIISNNILLTPEKDIFVVDTKPIAICENIRICRCKLAGNKWQKVDEDYRGYTASKRQYYYGFKLSLLVDCLGIPKEYSLHPASIGDLQAFYHLNLNLPPNSEILADKIYNCFDVEQHLLTQQINLTPIRKQNMKIGRDYLKQIRVRLFRRPIETALSLYSELVPRLRATSMTGAVIKAHLSVAAFAFYQGFRVGVLSY
jgi:Transposase DDE domain